MDTIELPINIDEDVSEASIEEALETVYRITEEINEGEIPLPDGKELYDHANDLLDHVESELSLDAVESTTDDVSK